jgi:hypothetical protein
MGRIIWLAPYEPPEEGCDDRLGDNDLIVSRAPLEMQKLDADGLGNEHLL